MKTITAAVLAALACAPAPASAQEAGAVSQDGTVTVRQKAVSIADVMSGKALEPSEKEKDELEETKRHNREMEKRMRAFAKNNPFALPTKRVKQPTAVKRLPPNASRY